MKIISAHLDGARDLVTKANAQFASDEKAAKEAAAKLDSSQGNMRSMQGAFDILASAFASGTELENSRAVQLPASIQSVIGFEETPEEKV